MKNFLKKLSLFLILFIVINGIINHIYEKDSNEAIENKTHKNYLKWSDIHNNQNTYDLVVIGASRAYTAFDPKVLDTNLNLQSYNMGTSAQDIAESYYTLKEILKYQKPKYVVLDLFFPSSDDTHDYYQIFSNASFFKTNDIKYDLVTKGYGASGIINYAVPVIKFKNYLKQDINGLFSSNNEIEKKSVWYKGFLHDTTTITNKGLKKLTPISNYQNTTFNKDRFELFFNKIKTLSEENDIMLITLRTPYPPSRLALNTVDDEADFFTEYMQSLSIPFFDLNTYKKKKYQYEDFDFSDYHHPNYRGAKKASLQLSEAIEESK
ncbi:hypothetical protein [uncultured Winogradskyella sp.]|uniref:hypothetical protein n=1 Tax=uncultured Winogradskyella sp. TaxID=395353 RepID=UPI0026057309|nr:hypothetical protein [uncultured Winogradskyella sp.]